MADAVVVVLVDGVMRAVGEGLIAAEVAVVVVNAAVGVVGVLELDVGTMGGLVECWLAL